MAIVWRGIIAVAGAFLVQLTLGFFNTDGNMIPYMISYLHERIDSSTVLSYTAFLATTHAASHALLMVPSGYLAARIGYRLTAIIAATLLSGGIALTYFTIKISFVVVLLTYGILGGFGVSIGYGNGVACAMKWFPSNRGIAGGIVLAGYGLAALAFNPLQSNIVNPDNVSPTKDGYFVDPGILNRLPFLLLQMAGVFTVIQIIGCIMISQPPELDQQVESSTTNLTPLQVLRTKEFYILWLILLGNSSVMVFFNAMYKNYGQTFIHDDHYLAYVGSLMSILNSLGRCLWGFLLDRYSYISCIRTVTTGLTVLMFTMPATKAYGGKVFYTVWSAAVFFFLAGTFASAPVISATVFGTKHLAANYGLIFTNMFVASITVATLSIFMNQIGYLGVFYAIGGMNAFGLVMTFAFEYATKTKQPIERTDPKNSIQTVNKLAVIDEINGSTSSNNAKMYERPIGLAGS